MFYVICKFPTSEVRVVCREKIRKNPLIYGEIRQLKSLNALMVEIYYKITSCLASTELEIPSIRCKKNLCSKKIRDNPLIRGKVEEIASCLARTMLEVQKSEISKCRNRFKKSVLRSIRKIRVPKKSFNPWRNKAT